MKKIYVVQNTKTGQIIRVYKYSTDASNYCAMSHITGNKDLDVVEKEIIR